MTEAEWGACEDPCKMVRLLDGRVSRRKLRWFAVACCRLLWEHLKAEEVRQALGRAEQYADGLIRDSTAYRWSMRANSCKREIDPARPWELQACHAVHCASLPDSSGGVLNAPLHVGFAVIQRTLGRNADLWEPEYQAAQKAAYREMAPLLREVVGDPFRPPALDPAWLTWQGGTVPRLARLAYEERHLPGGHLDPARLAILADALEEAGCGDETIPSHLRAPGPHVRGCFAVDALAGKG